MSWGPIQLRLKGSKQVEFEGEASPAPGGGSMPGGVIITTVTIPYSDLVDTGNGYRFAPIVDLVVGDVLLWCVAFVTVAFNDSNAGTTAAQTVESSNRATMGLFQSPNLDVAVLPPGEFGYVNLSSFDSATPDGSTLPISPIMLMTMPLTIGVTDNGGLAGDGTTGEILACYAKASQ